jgi:HK97 family phage portal protein
MPNPLAKGLRDVIWSDDGAAAKTTGNVGLATRRSLSRALSPTESAEVSIAVHRAVNSIAGNISQAEWRLYTRSGREITGGPLYDLLKRPGPRLSRRQMVYELVSWACIWGEFALWLSPRLDYLLPLAPPKLQIDVPTPGRVKNRNSVQQWRYSWCDGEQSLIPDQYLVFDATFNPNAHEPVRGLSPLTVGATQISAAHYATRYNQQFFENNAVPSHIIALAGGIGRANRQEIERKYQQEFSGWAGNAHKVMMISGVDEVKHIPIETSMKDAEFLELQKYTDAKVSQLYGVPPIEMNIYDKTRYDSAPMERQTYIESVLRPIMDRMAEVFQLQLIDPYFRFSETTTQKPKALDKPMSKRLSKAFEKARYEQGNPPIVLLIDSDTLPIMAQVKAAQIEQAQKFRDTAMMSATEIIDYFDLDVPHREERDDIFVQNTYSNYTNPEKNPAYFMQQAAAAQESEHNMAGGDGAGTNEKKPSNADKQLANKVLRKLRSLTFANWDVRKMWTLAKADDLASGLAPGLDLRVGIRRLRSKLQQIVEQFPEDGALEEIKYLLNHTKPEDLLGGGVSVTVTRRDPQDEPAPVWGESPLNELLMSLILSQSKQPAPAPQPPTVVTLHVPEQPPPNVTVNVPELAIPTINLPAPNVTFQVPDGWTPNVTVNVPELATPNITLMAPVQEPPSVIVNVPQAEAPKIIVEVAPPRQEAPIVQVNLPEMNPTINVAAPTVNVEAPVVNVEAPNVTVDAKVNVPKQPTPEVTVEVPAEKDKKIKVERDRDGKIVGATVRCD